MMQTVTLPRRMVQQVLQASETLTMLREELEDYLLAHQPGLVKKLRQARREHLAGKTRPFVFLMADGRMTR